MNNLWENFTGRKRYRVLKRLFKEPLMILQLEVEGWSSEYGDKTWWVDALPEHITINLDITKINHENAK